MAALITHSDISTVTGRTYSADQQAALTEVIGMVEAFAKRTLLDWTKANAGTAYTYDGDDTRYLWLRRYCSALTGVEINGSALASADYRLKNGICIERLDGGVWDYDPDSIEVTGTWGFDAADAPADFRMMLAQFVAKTSDAYGKREVSSESIGNVSFTYLQSTLQSDALMQMLWMQWAPLGVV